MSTSATLWVEIYPGINSLAWVGRGGYHVYPTGRGRPCPYCQKWILEGTYHSCSASGGYHVYPTGRGRPCPYCQKWILEGVDHICQMQDNQTAETLIKCPHCKKVIEVMVKEAESTTEGR